MASPVERLIATATQEIGYLEKKSNSQLDDKTANAGYNNWTKYARDLDNLGVYRGRKNGYAWCDMFVDWCFVQTFGLEKALLITGQQMNGYGAGCTESANYYKKIGCFFTSNPQPGDQIFFKNNEGGMAHTGIVTKVKNGIVYTIEGNTSSTAGVVANGGAVRDKQYPITYIKIGGYGRPKYELIEEEDEDMTDERFNELMNNWLAKKAAEEATWGTENLEWGLKYDIMHGNAGHMMPNKFCTRLEVITMLKRLGEKLGLK